MFCVRVGERFITHTEAGSSIAAAAAAGADWRKLTGCDPSWIGMGSCRVTAGQHSAALLPVLPLRRRAALRRAVRPAVFPAWSEWELEIVAP